MKELNQSRSIDKRKPRRESFVWSPDSSKPNLPIKEVKLFKFRDEFEKNEVPDILEKATAAKKFQSWAPIKKLWLNSGWIDVSKVEESFYCTDLSPPEIQTKVDGIYDCNFIESLSGIEKPFYEAQPYGENGVEKSSNTLNTGWPKIEFSGKSGIATDGKGDKESGMEKSNDDSDFDGKLVILENDDIGNFTTSQTDDYEIDIVDSNGEFEIHMKSLTREEIEADIENMRKQNAEIDIMSLPCVFAENLSLDTDMMLNLNNSETNEPIPTLAIIPPDDNSNGAEGNNTTLLEADGTQFVTEETDNSQNELSVDNIPPPILPGNQKIENGRKKKYYLCFEAECLFSERFGRFDTKQKIKRHLYNEHGIRDKIKLEKKATRCQIIIKLAPLPDKIFAETATQTCTGKNDKRLQKKKACHGTTIKSAKGKRPEGESPKKEVKKSKRIKKRKNSSGSESETSESSFQLSSNKKASAESDSQEPGQRSSFVCTQEPCVYLNPQLSFGTQREFRYHVRQHHNKLKTESAKEKSAKVKTENSRRDEPSTSSDGDSTNASPPEDENRVYKCESCDSVLNSKRDYNLHAQMHALHDPTTCDICKRTFNSLDQLQVHKEEFHMAKKQKCQACGQEFRLRLQLLQHLRSVHSNDLPMLCPICDKGFLTKSELEIHAVKIHGLTVAFFKCEKCGRAFNNKIGLRIHISHYHKFAEEKPQENGLKSGQKKMKKIK